MIAAVQCATYSSLPERTLAKTCQVLAVCQQKKAARNVPLLQRERQERLLDGASGVAPTIGAYGILVYTMRAAFLMDTGLVFDARQS